MRMWRPLKHPLNLSLVVCVYIKNKFRINKWKIIKLIIIIIVFELYISTGAKRKSIER